MVHGTALTGMCTAVVGMCTAVAGIVQEAVMNSRGAQQALVPGRMVITLNQRSGLPELGVVCGTPSPSASPLGAAIGLSGKSSAGFGALQPSTTPSTGECICL